MKINGKVYHIYAEKAAGSSARRRVHKTDVSLLMSLDRSGLIRYTDDDKIYRELYDEKGNAARKIP